MFVDRNHFGSEMVKKTLNVDVALEQALGHPGRVIEVDEGSERT